MSSTATLAPTSFALAFRSLLDRFFRRKPGRIPRIYETTTWLGVRNAFTHPPEREDIPSLIVLNYACAVGLFFDSGAGRDRPACTLANVAVTVSLVDYRTVLAALASDAAAARLVEPLLNALRDEAPEDGFAILAILYDAQVLVADLISQVDASTRERVLAYFHSIA